MIKKLWESIWGNKLSSFLGVIIMVATSLQDKQATWDDVKNPVFWVGVLALVLQDGFGKSRSEVGKKNVK